MGRGLQGREGAENELRGPTGRLARCHTHIRRWSFGIHGDNSTVSIRLDVAMD